MSETITRGPRGRFAKGHSGNPSGRPAGVPTLAALAEGAAPKAIATLYALLEHPDGQVRANAAATLAKLYLRLGRHSRSPSVIVRTATEETVELGAAGIWRWIGAEAVALDPASALAAIEGRDARTLGRIVTTPLPWADAPGGLRWARIVAGLDPCPDGLGHLVELARALIVRARELEARVRSLADDPALTLAERDRVLELLPPARHEPPARPTPPARRRPGTCPPEPEGSP